MDDQLDDQDQGAAHVKKKRGRKLSDSGTKARFYRAVCDAHFAHIIKVDLKAELFSYAVDEKALALARMMDGKLLVVTNVRDMDAPQVIERYKSLADIERGFKVLKSELEIGPVYHRLPERIRAHASICFMALILHRIMRPRLREGKTELTPERALQSLKRIQHHRVSISGAAPLSGVSINDGRTQRNVQGIESQNIEPITATSPVVRARFKPQVNEINHLRA